MPVGSMLRLEGPELAQIGVRVWGTAKSRGPGVPAVGARWMRVLALRISPAKAFG